MKILFLETSPIRRGAQIFIVDLADALESKGIHTQRVYLYASRSNESNVPVRKQDLVLGFDSTHFFEKIPTLQPGLLWALLQVVNDFTPDIILLNGSRTLKYGAALKRFFPVKAKLISRIIDNAEFWNSGKFTHWYYKKLVIPKLDATIGVSQASLTSMMRHYQFTKPSTVIHRVFDPRKFENALNREETRKKLRIGTDEEVLLFLGNLTAQKRPDRFLEIVSTLSQSRPKLKALFVGDGVLRKELENKVANSTYQVSGDGNSSGFDLRSSIVFAGYQQDVSSFLASADVLVLTSDTEGLPGVVLEAAHFKVPSVCTAVGGIRECLIDGETGFLIPDRSVDAFCEKINFLLDHSEAREAMGERAADFVSANFKMDLVAQQYLDFFDSLLVR
jgi:glycosyltransferase involved in cell wall biosynthesis